MPIIGTAGHVDHGKSTLVEALTGRDPDRWAEEKARGLTIDLGFAWTRLDDATEVGFVDVPGHERFIKNMLAGVGALDAALLVVAADEGWMPQTEEHFGILDLLDVRHGVVAVTRTDLVDTDLLELAVLDVDEHVTGTSLEQWPIIPVSAVTGFGMQQLRTALAAELAAAGPPVDLDRPKLWIDRSFIIGGAGVVVTGTLTGGSLGRDDEVVLWPGGRPTRIRGIQSHEHETARAAPGTRTAINLAGIDTADAPRGTLLTRPGAVAPSRQLLLDVRRVRSAPDPITNRGAYHLHAGTGSWPVAVRVVEGDAIEDTGAALVALPIDLGFEIGDHVILREVGRRAVVAGGRVLDPSPGGRLSAIIQSLPELRAVVAAPPDARAAALLAIRGIADTAILAAHSGGGSPHGALRAGARMVSPDTAHLLRTAALDVVAGYQRSNPLRPGMPKAELASGLGIDLDLLDVVVDAGPELVDSGSNVRSADFEGGWGADHEAAWQRARELLVGDGLAVRRASQLELDPEVFHALLRDRRLVRIDDDLAYLPEQVDEILARLQEFAGEFTVSGFRKALSLSRRHAVPILEWLDAQGWTSRRGDVRTVRRRLEPGSSDARTP